MPAIDVIKKRRGTAAAWTSANPILADGEEGYEKDTGKSKVGDGTTAWVSLGYYGSGTFELLKTPAGIDPYVQGARADYTGRHGTVGTGTDSRAAIQMTLNNASDVNDASYYGYLTRRSNTVKLAPGEYVISAPTSGPSLTVPAGVTFDTSDATLFFDYPASATSTWCGIQVGQYANLNVGRLSTSGRVSVPDSSLVYDAVRLVRTDNNSRIIGYKDSEIWGFQGAGIRGIGAWISFVKGIRFYGCQFGYVASNIGDGTLGPTLLSGETRRVHTDLRIEDCLFINMNRHAVLGTVQGVAGNINTIDQADSGLTVSLIGCVAENIGYYAYNIGDALTLTMVDCGLEEVGNTDGMVQFDNVRIVTITGLRVNLAGLSVPGPSGNVTPFPSCIFKLASIQSFSIDGMYCHNTYNAAMTLVSAAPARGWSVTGIYTDANAIATDPIFTSRGTSTFSGLYNAGHVAIGGHRLWTDAAGYLRHKSAAPSTDTDGAPLLPSGAVGTPLVSAVYYTPGFGNVGTLQSSEANELATPLLVGRTCTLNSIAVLVTTAGSTGALVRLGIRSDSGGVPGAVLVDAGTVDGATTGTKVVTVSVSVVEGQIIWLTMTLQGASTTRTTVQSTSNISDPRIGSATAATILGAGAGSLQSGSGTTTGALPGSQTWVMTGSCPRLAVRSA